LIIDYYGQEAIGQIAGMAGLGKTIESKPALP
jgi:hypothetical protein